MNESPEGLSEDSLSFDPPIARYTPSNQIPDEDSVKAYIDELDYQHDPVSAIHFAWVLEQMPDYQKRFPYFGVPLSQIAELIDRHDQMRDAPVKAVIGVSVHDEYLKTLADAPMLGGEVSIADFRAFITSVQASADRLFDDISLASCQYSDPDIDEANHSVIYADDPRNYDYFVALDDEFVLDDVEGGETFHRLDAVTFTDTITGLLQLKAKMLVDSVTEGEMTALYTERFVKPLLSPFAAAATIHGEYEVPGNTSPSN